LEGTLVIATLQFTLRNSTATHIKISAVVQPESASHTIFAAHKRNKNIGMNKPLAMNQN